MSDRRWQSRAAIGLPVCILLLSCASTPPAPSDLESILPDAPAELMHAVPAARDALEEGLRWIVLDAPGTNATSRVPVAAALRTAPFVGRREPTVYVTLGDLDLRQGPAPDQTILAIVPPGTRVVAYDSSGEWIRVATPTLGEGWLRRSRLQERLRPDDLAGSLHTLGTAPETAKRGVEQ